MTRRLRILTWHIHGSYLFYLGHADHEFFIPVKPGRPSGYSGLPPGPFPWPSNLHEVHADQVRRLQIDCVLFQSAKHYAEDQYHLLSDEQRRLPLIYLEHDPPRAHPTDSRHLVDDPSALLIHVTAFNELMWDSGRTPTRVVEHGVVVPEGVRYSGEIPRAIAVVNHLASRGRRLGADVFERVRAAVPVDLVGLDARAMGGLGEVPHDRLPAFVSRYRVFFNPIRYTSLGLAVCEAMMIGLPVVGLATTEMAVTIAQGKTGFVQTSVEEVIDRLVELIRDPEHARRLGAAARRVARKRFAIDRFVRDWNAAFALVTGTVPAPARATAVGTLR